MAHPIRIGYVSAIWGREWLTRSIFSAIASLRDRLAPEIEIIGAISGSEGDKSRILAESYDFKYIEVPNEPLGAKWNAALGLLRDERISGACILGSDDLINEQYFLAIADRFRSGQDLIGLLGLYFLDQPTNRLLFWKSYLPPRDKEPAGAGRFVSSKILDQIDWQLWPASYNRGLDKGMRENLAKAGFTFSDPIPCRDGGPIVMDIKGHGGMNEFEWIAASGVSMLMGNPYDFMARNFSPDIAEHFTAPSHNCKCMDCWLTELLPAESEDNCDYSRPDPPIIWYVQGEPIGSSAQDFLLACAQGGARIRIRELDEFLAQSDTAKSGQALYGELCGETLFAMLATRFTKILDYRSIPDSAFRTASLKLPVVLEGYQGHERATLPLPFSIPPAYPCLAQRAHVVFAFPMPPWPKLLLIYITGVRLVIAHFFRLGAAG